MTRLLPALLLSTALVAAAAPAAAQDDRRVQELTRQVRELRAIVFQGRDTGQPVEIKPVGPDPQVVALEARVNDMAEQQRQMTGQAEVLQRDLEEARRTAEQLRADNQSYRATADARVARLEQQLAALQPAPAPVEPPPPPPGPVAVLPPVVQPPPARPPASRRAQELTARTQAADASTFGAAAGGGDGFNEAYQRLVDADYANAQAGFEGFVARNPADARAPEARFYVGQSLYMRESYGPAARAYAESLKGWPKTKWAPDATVKLAQSLNQLNQNANACAALAEFNRRYGATAPAAVKTRAAATRTRAQCTAG